MSLVNDNQATKASGLGGEANIVLDYLFVGLEKYSIDKYIFQEGAEKFSKTITDGPMISDHRPILAYLPLKIID